MPEFLKCRRCRWVGKHDDLRNVPDPKKSYLSHNVCPRCGCKSFSEAEEPKND